MGAKRALIVDDSKSARLFLARTLEKYDIDVDSAESAEAAIDYLNSNRPDVIFMDHLMPGMDGLQAVQAIKNDPRTATIPIMMYTSQEGELYLGQARALGAVGVLPKQIKPTDVSKVLYQLHLVADRRSPEQSSFTPLGVTGDAAVHEPAAPPLPRSLTESGLREHFAELRRALVAGIDTQTERITAEVRALLLEALPRPPQPPQPQPSWPWIVACVALGAALVSSILWWRSVQLLEGLQVQMTQLRAGQGVPAALLPQEAPSAQPVSGASGAASGSRVGHRAKRRAGSCAGRRAGPRCRGAIPGSGRCQADHSAGTLWSRCARWRTARGDPPAALPAGAAEGERSCRHQELCRTFLPRGQRARRLFAGARRDAVRALRPGRQPFRGSPVRAAAHPAGACQPHR